MTEPLSVSQIRELAENWPPQSYWDTGAKVITASYGNRFVVHQPKMKDYVIIEFDGVNIKGIERFENRFAARNRIQQLWREDRDGKATDEN